MSHHPKIRGDLVYTPDPEREGYWYIKDPIRGEYLSFNEVQVEMMRALDGSRSPEDIHELLGEELGIEVPVDKIQSFTSRLEREYLLDISTYRIDDDEQTRKVILKLLEKRKLVFRAKPRDGSQPEGQLFTQGMEHLLRGNPSAAAGYFTAVLEINPNNERAKQVVAAIHEGFLKTKVYTPGYKIHFPIWNPENFLVRLDRAIGKVLFSKLGLFLVIALVISALFPMVDILSRPTVMARSFDASDFIVFLLVLTFFLLFHEAMHGLACTHYGGRVTDIGFQLFYFLFPGAYCDTSDVFVFANRKHKAIVFMAGVGLELVPMAILWHLLYVLEPTVPGWNGLVVIASFVAFNNYNNLVPLVQLDGYYAFAAMVGQMNLRRDSFAYVRRVLGRTFLGLHSEAPEPDRRQRRLYLIFGIAACAYTAFFLLVIWIGWFLPWIVEQLGFFGFVIAVVWFANVLGRKAGGALIRFIILLVRERTTVFTARRTLVFTAVLAVAIALLAAPFSFPIDGQMILEPQQQASARVTEPGTLATVAVQEGALVRAGETLATLHSPQLEREHAAAVEELAIAKLALARLESGASAQELHVALARSRARRVQSTIEQQRLYEARRERALGVSSTADVAAAQREVARADGMTRITDAETRLVKAGSRREEIEGARVEVRHWETTVRDLEQRLGRLRITSPITGVVVGRRVQDRIGERFATGDELFQVQDTTRWRARIVPVRGESLTELQEGQTVAIRPFGSPHDLVEARVEQILPPTSGTESLIITTSPFEQTSWRGGMSGRARIYGPRRSLAYRLIAVPIIQIVDYDLWSFI